ncbi:carbohydrate-binding family 9-like protein [Treponema sp. TIM-1]|uniref:carbohydrate-binding family 9-like protein n=1 Tax=Treponema sp. TIM-1 TaxID=2898417 RepID=UPI00397FB2A1
MHTYPAIYEEGIPPWDSLEKAEITIPQWIMPPEGLAAFARLCYDQEKLKLRLQAQEKKILSRFSGLTDMVCNDSCLEFFFSPVEGDLRYFNFEFNPRGSLYLGYGVDRDHSHRLYIPEYRELFAVSPFSVAGGWGIDFSIPLTFIRIYAPAFTLETGRAFRANFYKCGDETEVPHYLVWNTVESPVPDFHRPECFGKIVLE